MITKFQQINDKMNWGFKGKYRFFRTHTLRKFHASILYNHENGLSLEEIDALQGRGKNNTHASYFMENPKNLKEKYINSLKSILIFN